MTSLAMLLDMIILVSVDEKRYSDLLFNRNCYLSEKVDINGKTKDRLELN